MNKSLSEREKCLILLKNQVNKKIQFKLSNIIRSIHFDKSFREIYTKPQISSLFHTSLNYNEKPKQTLLKQRLFRFLFGVFCR